jgi:hypothetical protein
MPHQFIVFLFGEHVVHFWSMINQQPIVKLMMKHKKLTLILLGNLVALFILISETRAQVNTSGYIYGRVTTYDNTYQGHIRWGKEEAFWNDYFNASKGDNKRFNKYINRDENRKGSSWDDFDWDFSSIWENKYGYVTHQFSAQFGDLKSIYDIGRSDITVELKNGTSFRLDGDGYNDVGTSLRMDDDELGEITIKWDRIERVDFMPTPRNLKINGGDPIYGTVETYRKGTFTGFIQWDHDERLGEDKLDGDNRDGDVSIPFSQIRYIEKDGDGCHVELFSGRHFYLDNSNDVDNGNRGTIVSVPGIGKIDIPWRYFRNATFERAPNSGPSYDEYSVPKGLFGTVYTLDGEQISGKIIYDIDETWEIETLNGNDDEVEYQIAFRHIKAIVPKNYAYSIVELRNGDEILLGDERDVDDSNDGILVFENPRDEPIYISWRKVAEVVFD